MTKILIREECNHKLELFKLYNKLKRIIYRESDLNNLLSNVCKIIAEHSIYNSAWVITNNTSQTQRLFHSDNSICANSEDELRTHCYVETQESNTLLIKRKKDDNCNDCLLKSLDDSSTVFSIPLSFKGENYGVFAVDIVSEYSNIVEHQEQFADLAEDISYAIYNLKLEQKSTKVEKKLKQNNERFQSLLKTSPYAIIMLDLNMNFIFGSNKVWDMLDSDKGIPIEDFKISKILSAEDYSLFVKNFDLLRNQEVDRLEAVYHLKIKSGEVLIINIRSTLVRNINGEPESVAATIHDITKEHQRDVKLEDIDNKFTTIFQQAPNGISLLDKDAFIVDVNEMDCRLMGYSKEEMIGKHISSFFKKEYIPQFKTNYGEFMSLGLKEVEIELVRKDGTVFIARRSANAIKDNKNNIIGIVIHTHDYTEVHEAQKKIGILSEALEQSPSVVTMTDLEGNLTYVNKKFELATGYKREEVLGKNPRILKSDIQADEVYSDLWSEIIKGKQWSGRFCNKRKNGSLYWEHAIISPFIDKLGNVTGYLKASEDVTTLIKFEEELEESNTRYRNIFRLVPIPIIIHQNGKIVDSNKAALVFSGYKLKRDFVGSDMIKFVHPDYIELVQKRIKEVTSTQRVSKMSEEVFINTKGEERNVEVISSPMKYKGKQAFMVAFEDITERKQSILKLQESERKFRSIFDTNPDAISISRMSDGMFLQVSKGFCLMTGYEEDEVIGKTVEDLNLYQNTENRNIYIKEIKDSGLVNNYESQFRRKDGVFITTVMSARIVIIDGEEMLLFVAHDISRRKQMEEDLIKAKNKAEEHDKLKSAFLANMSHEIRTPMNAIIGFSDLLRDDDLSHDEQKSYIDIIQNKSDQLMVLINDIIDISKIESGALEMACEPVSINSIIELLRKNYSRTVQQLSEGLVSFVVEDTKYGEVKVNADSFRLNQVFNNLIFNAVKFTKEGEVKVVVEIGDANVTFHISDTGIGIAEENLVSIFNRFVQVSSQNDTLVGGTGLGLCITKNLMELMQGNIAVKSKIKEGSTFSISLPKAL